MGHQIIQQPDGRLAVWSSVVDDFVVEDASPEELMDFYAAEAADKARKNAGRLIGLVLDGQARDAYFQFTMTYDEARGRARAA